jgi:hypothetical protein
LEIPSSAFFQVNPIVRTKIDCKEEECGAAIGQLVPDFCIVLWSVAS